MVRGKIGQVGEGHLGHFWWGRGFHLVGLESEAGLGTSISVYEKMALDRKSVDSRKNREM